MIMSRGNVFAFPELRSTMGNIKYPCFAEVKYDGEVTKIFFDEDHIHTTNKYGTERIDWPVLSEISKILLSNDINEALLLGELFWEEGKRGDLYKLLSHKNDNSLNIGIFDFKYLKKEDTIFKGTEMDLLTRKEMLVDIFMKSKHIIQSTLISNKDELQTFYNNVISNGYEGIVVKNLNENYVEGPCGWVKIKEKDRTDYPIIFIDPVKERIEIGAVTRFPDGRIEIIDVGVKVTNKYKASLKIGDIVTIEHQGILESGSLRHPVFIPKKGGR
jgi:ATP-dependent DNA ligase